MSNSRTDNVFNQEVKNHLKKIVNDNLFSNGYIFYGPEGIGKEKTAMYFVQEIFKKYKLNSNIKKMISDNNHPDFLYIEPTNLIKGQLINRSDAEITKKNNNETIRIDQIRNIKIFLSQKSIEAEKKIVLIVDAHLLNEAASNCLLKTLEEPSNGIFILLTSQLNLLLETITSRCQIIRFKSLPSKEMEIILQNNSEFSAIDMDKNLNLKDLINLAQGSPGKLNSDIQIWKELPCEIKDNIESPLNNNLEILKLSKLISESLEIHQQIFLINIMQRSWWRETKNIQIIQKLEKLKSLIKTYVQPRLSWEVTLLRIAIEDL